MSAGYRGKQLQDGGSYYAPYIPMSIVMPKETWETYLNRLGSGLNGIATAPSTARTYSEEDIVANANKWMQKKYPGNYVVEQFFNAKKIKVDLRLIFNSPKDETFFKLKYS
jgi:hypothetical protein